MMNKKIHFHFLPVLCMLLSVVSVKVSFAQNGDNGKNRTESVQLIPIETAHSATVFEVGKDNRLHMVYLGSKLPENKEYNQIIGQYRQGTDYSEVSDVVYPASGSQNLFEPAISVRHADGNQSLDLKFVSVQTKQMDKDIKLTEIILKDEVYPFEVHLFYKTYFATDVVETWADIMHEEKGSVRMDKFASAGLYLRGSKFWLTHYHGDWAKEMRPEQTLITHGIKTLDSKLGSRADLFQPPVFMIALGQKAREDAGKVIYGSLEWSGNFRVDLELDNLNNLRVIPGINNYASSFDLPKDSLFTTAKFLYTFSDRGQGQASRQLQRWARDNKILDGNGQRLTLLNNWESTYFDFNEDKLRSLLKDTKSLGVDLFLLDDGWFGNSYPRNNDHAGLGDWQANRKKLPNGIASLVKEATNMGVKFGIWLEPEMVNPKSDLYHQHPDWVLKQAKRPEYYFRNQLVLDLTNPAVQDFIFRIVDTLFTQNPGLAYIKWDCNAVIYNAYSLHESQQGRLYIDYVQGLYNVLKRIRAKYPKIPMMLCSGGGGRVDYGALQYFTEFWPSDNTDPLERIYMQWEYSYFYPAIATANHVTNWGKQPLKYRVDVAMMGKMGFDIPVHDLSAPDLNFCQASVVNYNKIKDIIWHGDQYRLQSPWTNDVASLMYVDRDKMHGVIFNYLVNARYGSGSHTPIKWKGLDPNRKYRIREINLYPGTTSTLKGDDVLSGDFLMTIGYNPKVDASRSSVILVADAVQS
ncbi:alpha-galactosidase [Arachidicoccus ginsenosidivorans]|nr:alpha-galactosidase [Arachidicoccus ginsenosidivorans]